MPLTRRTSVVIGLGSAQTLAWGSTYYLPAILGIEAWFGTTEDCVRAALTGKWNGVLQ